MGKKFFRNVAVILIVFLLSLNLYILTDIGSSPLSVETDQVVSRAGAPPELRPGVTSPYPVEIDEDARYEVDLHSVIFQDPESEPLLSTLDEATQGLYSTSHFDAWIENTRHLYVQTKRNKVTSSVMSFTVSCTDAQSSVQCVFDITIKDINDTSMEMDEDSTQTINLPSTVFSAWPYTITVCTIDEAQLGEYDQPLTSTKFLFKAWIESNTVLKIQGYEDQIGLGAFNVSATDGTHSTKTEIHVTVNNVNDLPKWSHFLQEKPRKGDPKTIKEDVSVEYDVLEDTWQEYIVVATDVDGDTLIYEMDCDSDNIKLDKNTGRFNFTPTQEDIGLKTYEKQLSVKFICNDGISTENIETYLVFTIFNLNDAPENLGFTYEPWESDPNNITFTANPGSDKDGDDLTYIWVFGDGTDPISTTELTIEHAYPFVHKTENFTVTMQVYDSQAYSEWRSQSITIVRTTVEITTLSVSEGMKATLDLDLEMSEVSVHDYGIEASRFKGNRTIRIEGTAHGSTQKAYIYQSLGELDVDKDQFVFESFKLMKDQYGNDAILDPILGDFDITVKKEFDEVSIDFVQNNLKFRYAIVVWSEYGYDITYVNAKYTYYAISKTRPQDFPIVNGMEGSEDLSVKITSATVLDKVKSKVQDMENVTRTITLKGTCSSDVDVIFIYEKEEGKWRPAGHFGLDYEMYTFPQTSPSGGSWEFTIDVGRTIIKTEGNGTLKLEYAAVGWSSSDYDIDYEEAEYSHKEMAKEDEFPFAAIGLVVGIIFIIALFIGVLIAFVVIKKKQDERNLALTQVEKEEVDEFGQPIRKGAPGAAGPPQPGAGPPGGQPAGMTGPQYVPTPAKKMKQEVDPKFADMFSAGEEESAEKEKVVDVSGESPYEGVDKKADVEGEKEQDEEMVAPKTQKEELDKIFGEDEKKEEEGEKKEDLKEWK
jgi:hypothetical protein